MLKNVLIILLFIMVTYFVLNYTSADFKEALTMPALNTNCPNVLIQKGALLYLYNSKKKEVPGVNPVIFNNLEEYVEFVEFQRASGTICPVLYLQHSSEADGTESYKIRPSPTNLQGGLSGVPASALPYSPPPRKQNRYAAWRRMEWCSPSCTWPAPHSAPSSRTWTRRESRDSTRACLRM